MEGYGDDDDDDDDDAQSSIATSEDDAIRQTVARISGHEPTIRTATAAATGLNQNKPRRYSEDELSFADDSEEDVVPGGVGLDNTADVVAEQSQSHPHERPAHGNGWSCPTCTYINSNPLFLVCEMCSEPRPAGLTPPGTPPRQSPVVPRKQPLPQSQSQSQPQSQSQLAPPRNSTSNSNNNNTALEEEDGDKDKTENLRFSEILRLQQGLYTLAQPGPGQSSQQPQQLSSSSSSHAPSGVDRPETDHELALIYAQQERILAEYQRQQQQQRR
jgi:hypothetical protein